MIIIMMMMTKSHFLKRCSLSERLKKSEIPTLQFPLPNLGPVSTAQIGFSSIHCPIWVQYPLPNLHPVSTT